MSEKYVAPMPAVGMTVQFFAQAMTNETPQAALVLGKSNDRTIDLMVFARRGAVSRKIAVPHVSDPQLDRAEPQYRIMHGGWDFVPGSTSSWVSNPEAEQEKGSDEDVSSDPPRRGPGRPRKCPVGAS